MQVYLTGQAVLATLDCFETAKTTAMCFEKSQGGDKRRRR